jgi:hypothetical protein
VPSALAGVNAQHGNVVAVTSGLHIVCVWFLRHISPFIDCAVSSQLTIVDVYEWTSKVIAAVTCVMFCLLLGT